MEPTTNADNLLDGTVPRAEHLTEPRAEPWLRYAPRQRTVFLTVLFLMAMSNALDRNIIGIVLEAIKTEFQATDTMLGLLSGMSFALFYVGLGLPIARWADRGDRKLIITLSLIVWSVMTMLCGAAQSFVQLLIARVGVGAGEAGGMPPAHSLLADYFPPERRARALGVFMVSATAGYVIGLIGGGYVTQNYGWRTTFAVVGAIGLPIAWLTYAVLDEPRRGGVPVGTSHAPEPLLSAVAALWRKKAYVLVIAAMIFYYVMTYGAFVFTVSFIIRVHHMSVSQAGTLFGAANAVGALIGNLTGGSLADRLARRGVAWLARLTGYCLLLAWPFYELAFMTHSTAWMTVCLAFACTALSASVPPLFASLHAVCGTRRRATAVAIGYFFANLVGLGAGPVFTGRLSDTLALNNGPADGLRYALMIVMCVLLLSAGSMLLAARHMSGNAED